MQKKVDLCGQCEERMKEGYRLQRLPRPANYKCTCGLCGRRRFGTPFLVEKKERKDE